MTNSIGSTHVSDIAQKNVITVGPMVKMEEVARIFQENRINAAAVVDALDKCVGIITSQDVVRYESMRSSYDREFGHGLAFEIDSERKDSPLRMLCRPFDEVAYHMTKEFKKIEGKASLSEAARMMQAEHIHHLLILDDSSRPIGMLSTLDIIGEILGEPISLAQHHTTLALV